MYIAQMRAVLIKQTQYGPSWVGRVEKMSDKQVYAVYMRKLNNKELR